MAAIKMTSKRQATFPHSACVELGVKAGDTLTLQPELVGGRRVWVLERAEEPHLRWFGCLRRYARGKDHSMAAIRRSIARARKHGLT